MVYYNKLAGLWKKGVNNVAFVSFGKKVLYTSDAFKESNSI